jgi:hypothetical protein
MAMNDIEKKFEFVNLPWQSQTVPVGADGFPGSGRLPLVAGFEQMLVSQTNGGLGYGVAMPKWMVRINAGSELFSSGITSNDFAKNCIDLHGFHISVRRHSAADIRAASSASPANSRSAGMSNGDWQRCERSADLFTSVQIKHDNCTILIPSGGHITELENCLYKKKTVATVSLFCFDMFGGTMDVSQEITFQDSLIVSVSQNVNKVFVQFRVKQKTHSYTHHDSNTNAKGGVATCSMDFTTNK